MRKVAVNSIQYIVFYIYDKPVFIVWRYINKNKPLVLTCVTPFEDLEITQSGDCYICCPSWLPVVVGNINDNHMHCIFNSIAAQKVRMSLYRGDFRYCDRNRCTTLNTKSPKTIIVEEISLDRINEVAKREILERNTYIASPSRITEAVSEVCNIKCKFCWIPYNERKTDHNVLKMITLYIINNIDNIKMISFCGGEPLIQQHVKEILRAGQGKEVMFYFTSNLNFFDDEIKELIRNVNLRVFHLSLNAASEETYHEIVEGGNWDNVMENLDFILEQRRVSNIQLWMQMSMVVTNKNYRDIVQFAKFGVSKKIDKIIYYRMNDYGIPAQSALQLSEEDLKEIDLILKDPVFKDNKDIIEIGALKLD